MSSLYTRDTPKKPTNLTINVELLNLAKSLDLNNSAVSETALAEVIKQKKREQWLEENVHGISSYNKQIQEHGLFSDEFRAS
jgi:antitoxin CcdA